MNELLAVADLAVDYTGGGRQARAVDGADLLVSEAETVGIVGESGSGKSTLGLAVGALLPRSAKVSGGEVRLAGEPVHRLPPARLRQLRRERLGYVFQDPIASLDPTMRIGKQLRLALRGRGGQGDITHHLERVQLHDPRRIQRSYPHQLSGGMAQRVAIAMAMAAQPQLLVADEPTAALDSQVREEVLDTVFGLAADAGTSILLLSHDLVAIGRRCARVAVMYGGRVVEAGPAEEVLAAPRHPYTAALARSIPGKAALGARLAPIPGRPPVLSGPSAGCAFAPRCSFAVEACQRERPPAISIAGRHVLCHRAEELADSGALSLPPRGDLAVSAEERVKEST